MNLRKRTWCLGLAGLMAVAAPVTALAGSPEFARSAEEWAKLRDNVIEYDEIAELIHEYNATVQKSVIDYNEFRREYGDTNDEVSSKYQDLADELLSSVDYPDVDDPGYAATMSRIITNEQSAKNYQEMADDALEDSYVKRMTNSQAEAQLVSSAQSEMVGYYLNQLQLQVDQNNQELMQLALKSAETRRDIGMATEVDVLNAQENLRTAEQAIQKDQSAIESSRKRLQVMLGWTAEDMPEIREIPAVDEARIAAMDPAADKETALASSYKQLINKRQLENARSADKQESLQTTVADTERSIGVSLTAEYQSVLAAKTAYEVARAQSSLEEQNLRTAELKYSTGQMSQTEHQTQVNTTETAALNVETARLNLFQAVQSYEWMLNGLAGA